MIRARIWLVVVLIGVLAAYFLLFAGHGELVTVLRVIDGDTLEVEYRGVVERLRLIGIDAPERNECFYDEATEALSSMVQHGQVRLEVGTESRDKYGRLLGYVFTGGTFINEEMVTAGYATEWQYGLNDKYVRRLVTAESLARRQARGLWGRC